MSSLRMARVAILEGRLSNELASLVRRHGGVPYYAPAVREVPLESSGAVAALLDRLSSGAIAAIVFMTGAGARALFQEAEKLGRLQDLLASLRQVKTVCRGPKPTAVLRQHGVPANISSKEPHTTRDLLEAMTGLDLFTRRVAVVHYGERSAALAEALRAKVVEADEVLLYQWMLPENTAPLRGLIKDVIAGQVTAVAFTSQVQARHLFRVAEEMGEGDALAESLNTKTVVASVGPTCNEALRSLGIAARVVPQHPKMGHLIVALAQHLEAADLSAAEARQPVAAGK